MVELRLLLSIVCGMNAVADGFYPVGRRMYLCRKLSSISVEIYVREGISALLIQPTSKERVP